MGPRFLYEVTLYKDYKNRSEIADSRFFSAIKPVKYKSPQICKMDGYTLSKHITWLEAPLDYLISNGFKEFINENIRRKRKSNTG